MPTLDKNSLRILGFADAQFSNNHDLSTWLGHVCLLFDGNGNSVPVSLKLYKFKLVVRSAMAGEVIVFSDLFDIATTLSSHLGDSFQCHIHVQILIDPKSLLFDIISNGSRTPEKRTMLDIVAAREGFRDKCISDFGC